MASTDQGGGQDKVGAWEVPEGDIVSGSLGSGVLGLGGYGAGRMYKNRLLSQVPRNSLSGPRMARMRGGKATALLTLAGFLGGGMGGFFGGPGARAARPQAPVPTPTPATPSMNPFKQVGDVLGR